MILSYDYIRGLIEGEGTFTFDTRKQQNGTKLKIPTFALSMHIRDEDLIEAVRDTLRLKNKIYIYDHQKKDGYHRGPKAILIVREFPQLKNIIVPFFYKKLKGNKGRQFISWLEKIGTDPDVSKLFKLIYRLYKAGYYDKNQKFSN
ncbi:MAG: LAGLIDADG family homing endonuclease [Candidatus Niyogibacteria bacterium]|nr:LAGLIDADG family homing endonuclease [Candidatus Niyogibacteria bacterium]